MNKISKIAELGHICASCAVRVDDEKINDVNNDIDALKDKINELIAAVNILAGHETPGLFEENPIEFPDNTKIHKPIPGLGKRIMLPKEACSKIKVGYWIEIAGTLYTVTNIESAGFGQDNGVFIKWMRPTNKYER